MAATRRPVSSMTSEKFLSALTEAKIIAPEQAGTFLQEFRQTQSGNAAEDLARYLVRAGFLTLYQVNRTLFGEAKALVLGPYTLQQPIGSGSLGTVYSAIRRSDQSRYAIKVLPLRNMWNVLQAKKQLREFDYLRDAQAVIPFVDIGTAAGSHYLVWPFVEGESFDHLVQRTGPLNPNQAARSLYQTAEGMNRCHEQGIVHGILKPSNIMLGPDRHARILDLGIGAILMSNIADDDSLLDTISTANTAMNMLDFTAPESFADPNRRTVATDMYSLGCTAYFMLTNSVPFPEGNTVHKIIAHQTSPPPEITTRGIPPKFVELVQRMMAKSSIDRPRTMSEVMDCLNDAIPGVGTAAIEMPASEAESLAQRGRAAEYLPRQWSPDSSDNRDVSSMPGSEGMIDFDTTSLSGSNLSAPSASHSFHPILDTIDLEIQADSQTNGKQLSSAQLELLAGEPTPTKPTVESPPVKPSLMQRLRAWWESLFVKNDVVQFSLFGPPMIVPGRTSRLQLYVHPPAAFDSVRKLSRAFQPTTELIASVTSSDRPLRGREMTIQLNIENVGLSRSRVREIWSGQTRPWIFDLYVPWESHAGIARGQLIIAQATQLLGSSELSVQVASRTN